MFLDKSQGCKRGRGSQGCRKPAAGRPPRHTILGRRFDYNRPPTLERFDQEWWLDQSVDVDEDISVDVEYR